MEKRVRIGKIEDQDRFRREDMLRMTPNERLQMLVDMQVAYFPEMKQKLKRVAQMRQLPEGFHAR